jgi:hypothetical protein
VLVPAGSIAVAVVVVGAGSSCWIGGTGGTVPATVGGGGVTGTDCPVGDPAVVVLVAAVVGRAVEVVGPPAGASVVVGRTVVGRTVV